MKMPHFKYLALVPFGLICLISFSMISVETKAVKENIVQQSDSLTRIWDKHISDIKNQIKGKENLPVDSVFKNVKNENFKRMPAVRLLAVMRIGYSKSLGVGCGHCHNTNDWASDEKVEKQITRDMSDMVKTINQRLLTGIEGLKGRKQLFVNCTTCHRGQTKPALDLER